MTEEEAAERLHSDRNLSPEERARWVERLRDPDLSMYVLGDDPHGETLTDEQAEKLFTQVLTSRETVEIYYINLTESGVELTVREQGWLPRLKEALAEDSSG